MELIFEFAGDMVVIKIQGADVTFATSQTNFNQFVPIEAIRLTKEGILKEHPDLKDNPDMRNIAIKRFKEHIKNLGGENKIKDYVIEELENQGYILRTIKKEGFRPVKVK